MGGYINSLKNYTGCITHKYVCMYVCMYVYDVQLANILVCCNKKIMLAGIAYIDLERAIFYKKN